MHLSLDWSVVDGKQGETGRPFGNVATVLCGTPKA